MSEQKHTGRNLAFTVVLNTVITLGQFIGGFISGSLALISDAIHNLSDVVSVIMAYFAHRLSLRPQGNKSTFGYKRAEILAAFINAFALIGISIYLFVEAIKRFIHPENIDYRWMLWLGILGFVANALSVFALHSDHKHNLNIRAAYLHLIGDAMTSLTVIVGAICIWSFDIGWIDSLVTVVISVYIFVHTFRVLKESTEILMQFAPSDIDQDEVVKVLRNVNQVKSVHHIHLWRLSDHSIHFEAHICLNYDVHISKTTEISRTIEELLKAHFKITHVTLQYEFDSCSGLDC